MLNFIKSCEQLDFFFNYRFSILLPYAKWKAVGYFFNCYSYVHAVFDPAALSILTFLTFYVHHTLQEVYWNLKEKGKNPRVSEELSLDLTITPSGLRIAEELSRHNLLHYIDKTKNGRGIKSSQPAILHPQNQETFFSCISTQLLGWLSQIHIRVYRRNTACKDCAKGDEQPACQWNPWSVEPHWQKSQKRPVEADQWGRQKAAEWMYIWWQYDDIYYSHYGD